jgi:hypothetical protein
MNEGFTVLSEDEYKELQRKAKFYDTFKVRCKGIMYNKDYGDISINLIMIGEEACEEFNYN